MTRSAGSLSTLHTQYSAQGSGTKQDRDGAAEWHGRGPYPVPAVFIATVSVPPELASQPEEDSHASR
jgi:hypothetical protein